MFGLILFFIVFFIVFFNLFFRVIYAYQRGVFFTLGRYTKTKEPGLRFILPIIQTMTKVDMRTTVVDVPDQECITKDNISVKVNAVLYYKVVAAEKAVIKVEDFMYAISQLSQTTMRNVVGEATLDQLLSQRDAISNRIQQIVDKATDPWGIKVNSVDIKRIELPSSLKRTMAKEAEAERERRAVIIKAHGEVIASQNVSKAAHILSKTKGAMHLRTLQTLNDISSDQTNTIVFAVPLEVINALESAKTGWKK